MFSSEEYPDYSGDGGEEYQEWDYQEASAVPLNTQNCYEEINGTVDLARELCRSLPTLNWGQD